MTNSPKPIGGWRIDRPFPGLMTDARLREVFNISDRTFRDCKRLGRFKALEAQRVPGVTR
jgi:hypothetical protein